LQRSVPATELKQSLVRSTLTGTNSGAASVLGEAASSFAKEALMTNFKGWAGPVVAGLGCTSGASFAEIDALLRLSLIEVGLDPSRLVALATHRRRADHPAMLAMARQWQVPLHVLDDAQLGLGGVCEGAAGAAGPLLLGKRKSARATCALAAALRPYSSAAMASSMLATS
jgi:cobalamin biosynthesis protein CbiG